MSAASDLPSWALAVLRAPGTGAALTASGPTLATGDGAEAGRIDAGIARFRLPDADASIAFYQAVGGAHFHERSKVAYAMTTLDTPVYHAYLEELGGEADRPAVDVGGGDGRNALAWLRRGFEKVIVVDAAHAALARLRARVAAERPEWLERLLLVEADARSLPLAGGVAGRVAAIESLAYLNEDYARGVGECARILAAGGRILVADRDYEAGLLMRLLYFGGVSGMLEFADGRDLWDGAAGRLVRSRCFTAAELAAAIRGAGLNIVAEYGVSGLSLVVSFLRGIGRVAAADESRLPEIHALLGRLGRDGRFRRSHVVVAEKTARR